MSFRYFGAEKLLVKVDQVLGGVHPEWHSAVVLYPTNCTCIQLIHPTEYEGYGV